MMDLADMALFVRVAGAGSLSAAGRELGLSPAVASKRLARLEGELGVRLVNRTSRRVSLTVEGVIFHERCAAILTDLEDATAATAGGKATPRGTLKVTATVAFGRRWVGPAAADFVKAHHEVSIQLDLSDTVVDLLDGGFDLAIRLGALDDSRLVSRTLAPNRRVVCAAPAYLRRHGTPRVPADLERHQCLVLLRRGMASHAWTFKGAEGAQTVRVTGALFANSGDVLNDWALAGRGLVYRSIWDVAEDLASGRLRTVLDDYATPDAAVHAVYPSRRFLPARTRLFIEWLQARLAAAQRNLKRQLG